MLEQAAEPASGPRFVQRLLRQPGAMSRTLLPTEAFVFVVLFADRFRTLVFWLFAENEALYPRLDARVDKMIEVSSACVGLRERPKAEAFIALGQRGLLDEIDELWKLANRPGAEPTNYSKGIFQSIGSSSSQGPPSSSATTSDPSGWRQQATKSSSRTSPGNTATRPGHSRRIRNCGVCSSRACRR